MEVSETLAALDAAIATRGDRRPLRLTGPVVLGLRGRPMGDGSYGYTKGQCRRMRRIIMDAARADGTAPGGEQ